MAPETVAQAYALYEQVKSLPKVGKRFGKSPAAMWYHFTKAGLPMLNHKAPALPFIEWEGERYAPDKDGYFRKTSGNRQPLHKEMWRKAHGRIKRGWVVRFVDGDKMNVEMDNLEAVPREEMHHAKPLTLKPCAYCGNLMGRRATGNNPEGPSAYAKRKTCNPQCSGKWKRGKKRGTKMRRIQ